jgi:hypothetical protein
MDLAMFGVASTLAFGVAAAATPIHLDTANYTYWCIGSCDRDASVTPHPGLILMGGGTDVDSAFQQHIKWSAGGDFLVQGVKFAQGLEHLGAVLYKPLRTRVEC